MRVIQELSNRLKSGTASFFYGGSIRARVFRGGASLGTASVVEQAFRFGRNMRLYAMAIYLAQTPTSFLMNTLGQTLLPTLSNLQNDEQRVNRILVKVSTLLVFLGLPAIAFIYFCGRSVLTVAYGGRYSSATNALTVASLAALLNLLNSQLTTVFYAKGLPQLHRRSVALMAGIMLLMIYPCAKLMGVAGGQVACLIAVFFGYMLQLERVHHITGLDLRQYARPMLFSVLLSLGVVALCLSTRLLSAVPLRPFANILVGFIACFAAYAIGGAIFLRNTGPNANRAQF